MRFGMRIGAAMTAAMLVCLAAAAGGELRAQGALVLSNETTQSWTTTGGVGGAVYEIQATGSNPLKIYRVGFRPNAGGTHMMDVYYRVGGCFTPYPPASSPGFAGVQNSGWVHAGSSSVTFPGAAVMQIPVDLNVSVPVNGILGICVISLTATPQYTSSTVAPDINNSDLTIRTMGIKASTPYAAPGSPAGTPFGSGNVPRKMPTTIWYDYDQFPGTHVGVGSVDANGGNGLTLGPNTIQATIRNMGTSALDNTALHAQYSVDGGTNWSTTQVFTFPSFPVLTSQSISFTAPWTATATAVTDVHVRLVAPTPIGQGDGFKSKVFAPDLDLPAVNTTPAIPALHAPNTVGFMLTNNGDWSHNGQPISVRYTIDGVNFVTQSFTPTTLEAVTGAQTFSFTTPLTLTTAGSYNLDVDIFPQVGGDPDTADTFRLSMNNVGIPFIEFGTGSSVATLGPPVYRGSSLTGAGNYSVYQMLYTPAQLPGLPSGVAMSSIEFFKANDTHTVPTLSHPMRVWLMNTTATTLSGNETVGTIPTNSGELVYENLNYVFPPDIGWLNFGPFNQPTPFIYGGDSLLVTVEWVGTGPTASAGATGTFSWRYDVVSSTNPSGRGYQTTAAAGPSPTTSVALSGLNSSTRKPHARFFYIPPTNTDLDVDSISFGTSAPYSPSPQVGSNVVNVTVRTFGTLPYTGTYNLQYSFDNGTNWVSNAPFTAAGLTQTGDSQTVTFTTPWVIGNPLAPQSLTVRFNPPVTGDPDPVDELTAGYSVDADVEEVKYDGPVYVLNAPITVKAVIKNDGGMSLNGPSIPLRYTIDGGTNWVNQSFTATTLGENGATQEFTFTTPVLFTTAVPHTITVQISPTLPGDTDSPDENGVTISNVGDPTLNLTTTDFPNATSFTGSNGIPFGNYGAAVGYFTGWTPQQLRGYQGDILEFGFQHSTLANKSWPQMRITMGEYTANPTAGGGPFLSAFDIPTLPPILVYDGPVTIDITAVDQYFRHVLQTPFSYSGQNNLGVYVELIGGTSTSGMSVRNYSSPDNVRLWNTTSNGPNSSSLGTNFGHPASFVFTPTANPGIRVQRPGVPVPSGSTDDLSSSLTATVPATLTYDITNGGASLPLAITSISVTDQVNCTAALVGTAPTSVAASGGTEDFDVTVTPMAGAYSFKITIVNNSSNVPDQNYVINVTGSGFVNTAPVIETLPGGGNTMLITEVCNDQPTLPSTGSEYVEFTNVSAQPVDITGWKVYIYEQTSTTVYSGYPKTLVGGIVPGGGTYSIVDSGSLPTGAQGESLSQNILWNSGASGGVVLVDALDEIVDAMFFGSSDPSQIQIPLTSSTVGVGTHWSGPAVSGVTTAGSTFKRQGVTDNNDNTDWSLSTGESIGTVNPGLTVPMGGGAEFQISGTHPNYLLETVVGSDLTLVIKADDVDTQQELNLVVDSATGGSLTPAAAGFTTTSFPMSLPAGSGPRVLVLLGTAIASGTVNFTATSTDNGHFPGTDTINFTVKIGARLDVDAIESSSQFTRVGGQKDFYRGQSGQPVDIRVSNNNSFAITLNSLDISVQPAAGGAPLTGFTFNTTSLPMSIPANTTNMLIPCTMDIAANASGGHDLACELTVNTGLAVDPAAPSTNPIIVIVNAAADEFQLFDGPVPTPMQISLTSFKPAVETVAYLQELTVTGGLGTYTWSITSGTLPTGLTLNASGSTILNASISGTPALSSSGPYPLTLQVSDGAYLATITLTMTVSQLQPLALGTITLANAREFVSYTMTTPLLATGGSLIYSYGIDTFLGDDLPVGLSLDSNTGVISGTPDFLEAGTYNLYFTVDDGITLLTQSAPTALVVEAHPLQWNTTTLPTANETVTYNFTLDTIGGTAPRLYSITSTGTFGILPAGLTLDAQTGEISGVPGVGTSGNYSIEFTVESGTTESEVQVLDLDVVLPPPLTITTAALAYAEVGQPYSLTITATGGSQLYTFSTGGGVLSIPNSIALSATGELAGTPEIGQDGRFSLTVIVNDGYGTDTATFDFIVLAPHQDRVVISEVDVGTGYVELSNTSTSVPVDLSGWRVVAWVDGTTPTSFAFDTIPGASLALPGEVVMLNMGGTAGGFWPTYATGSAWTASSTSDLALAIYDIHGNLNDFVVIGTVNVAALVDAAAAPAAIHESFAGRASVQNGAANFSLAANADFVGSAAGSPGVYNTGLPAQPLDLIKDDLKAAVEGETYWDFTVAKGGVPPYTYSLTAPGAAWLSISPTTGELTGTAPASSAGIVVVDLTVTDAALAVVTETLSLHILAATVTPSATFTVGLGEGQSFEGTAIEVPVTLSLATGVGPLSSFSFVIDLPPTTAGELAAWRVIPGGATTAAGRGVIARDIGNDRIYVSDIDFGGATGVDAGVVAIVTFVVPEDDNVDAPEGNYPVNISDVAATGASGPILAEGSNGAMELSNYAPADVNRDSIIDVVDVQLTVNIILSLFTPTYNLQGDASGDLVVDVVDVQTIVNCILFGGCD